MERYKNMKTRLTAALFCCAVVLGAQTAKTVTEMLVDSASQSEAEMNLVDGYSIAAKTGASTQ